KRMNGSRKPSTITLGRFTGRNLKVMRGKYDKALADMEGGKHPTAEKRRREGTSFQQVAERFIVDVLRAKTKDGTPALRQGRQVENYLRRCWLGQTGTHTKTSTFGASSWSTTWSPPRPPGMFAGPAAAIEREHILDRLEEVKADSKHAARHAMDAIR